MYSSPNSSNTIPFINGNNNNHDHQISPYPSSSNNVIRPFSIESNPSSSSSSSKQEQANNNNCVCAISLLSPPPSTPTPSSPSFSFFQFPYSPLFEDNEIFLNGEFHYLHHHQHHHQSLTRPGRDDQAGAANMEVVSVSNAIKNNNNTQGMTVSAAATVATTTTAAATTTVAPHQTTPTRRRTSKRDRHSKINTARGLRDRRMRLSLEVARRFFGLQDMLGFDKASKTVEWLLNQAKVEIKQLAREKKNQNHQSCSSEFNNGGKSASSTSECEGVSSLDEVAISQSQLQEEKMLSPPPPTRKRRGSNKGSRKSAFNQIGKESREKARERARERTREKTRLKKLVHQESSKGNNNNHKQCNKNNDDDVAASVVGLNRLSSWNPFENVEESAAAGTNNTNHHNHSSNRHQNQGLNEISSSHEANKDHHHHPCDYEEESLVTMSKWSPTMIFNPLINTSPILQEHHQFAEFHHQTMGKPCWEAYNNEV